MTAEKPPRTRACESTVRRSTAVVAPLLAASARVRRWRDALTAKAGPTRRVHVVRSMTAPSATIRRSSLSAATAVSAPASRSCASVGGFRRTAAEVTLKPYPLRRRMSSHVTGSSPRTIHELLADASDPGSGAGTTRPPEVHIPPVFAVPTTVRVEGVSPTVTERVPSAGTPRATAASVTSTSPAFAGQRPSRSWRRSPSSTRPSSAVTSTEKRRSPTVTRPWKATSGLTGAPTTAATAAALPKASFSRSNPGMAVASPGPDPYPCCAEAPWLICIVSGPSRRACPLPIIGAISSVPEMSEVAAKVTRAERSSVGMTTMMTASALRPRWRRTSRRAIRRATDQVERHVSNRLPPGVGGSSCGASPVRSSGWTRVVIGLRPRSRGGPRASRARPWCRRRRRRGGRRPGRPRRRAAPRG